VVRTVVKRAPAAEVAHTVAGTRAEVAEAVLRVAEATGRPVTINSVPPPAGDRRVFVTVRVLDRPATPTRTRRHPTAIPAAIATSIGVAGGSGYLAFLATGPAVANALPAVAGVGILLVLAALWFGLGRTGTCIGIHCPGCRHH
jgi:hypothetical protein